MRTRRIALLAAVAAFLAPAVARAELLLTTEPVTDTVATPTEFVDPTGVIASPNVEVVAEVPNPGAIGARFHDHHMYVTTSTGLTIYDIADPAAPREVGRLPLPHFENEDVDLGGDILLISNDAAESTGILYVIDISDPPRRPSGRRSRWVATPCRAGPVTPRRASSAVRSPGSPTGAASRSSTCGSRTSRSTWGPSRPRRAAASPPTTCRWTVTATPGWWASAAPPPTACRRATPVRAWASSC